MGGSGSSKLNSIIRICKCVANSFIKNLLVKKLYKKLQNLLLNGKRLHYKRSAVLPQLLKMMRDGRCQLDRHRMDLHGINILSSPRQITPYVKVGKALKWQFCTYSEIEYRLTNSSGNIGGCENYHIW